MVSTRGAKRRDLHSSRPGYSGRLRRMFNDSTRKFTFTDLFFLHHSFSVPFVLGVLIKIPYFVLEGLFASILLKLFKCDLNGILNFSFVD